MSSATEIGARPWWRPRHLTCDRRKKRGSEGVPHQVILVLHLGAHVWIVHQPCLLLAAKPKVETEDQCECPKGVAGSALERLHLHAFTDTGQSLQVLGIRCEHDATERCLSRGYHQSVDCPGTPGLVAQCSRSSSEPFGHGNKIHV